MTSDTLTFLLQQLGFVTNLKVCAATNPKYGILQDRERLSACDSNVFRNQKENDFNIKNLISSPKAKILKVTSLSNTLCLKDQAGPFCICLQRLQIQGLKTNPF